MDDRLVRKGLVVGIILLFIGSNFVSGFNLQLKNTTNPLINTRSYIQDLIDNASDGDTIYVPSGTYYEHIIINKSISLVGEDKDTTIIDGGGEGKVVFIGVDWVNISGFTIRNAGNIYPKVGMQIFSNHTTISSNNISNNMYGICFFYSSGNKIIDNTISSNIWGGIDFCYSNSNNIIGNDILDNMEGLIIQQSYDNTILYNNISNQWHGIHLLYYSSNNNIIGNNISNNPLGIYLDVSSGNNNIIGNNISNSNSWNGIYLENSSGNNITDNIISNNKWNGIELYYSSGNYIKGNSISNNKYYGIYLNASSCNSITCNTMVNDGIIILGYFLEHWNTHVIDISNTVNGKPVIYWKNQISGTIPTGAGQVILANCTNVIVENQNISSGDVGIELGFSSGCTITGNNATDNFFGIYLDYSSDNTITGNNIILNDEDGIRLNNSSGNIITGNTVSHNYYGIYLSASSGNSIIGNTILYGLIYIYLLETSNNNKIYHNNFIDIYLNVLDYGDNIWDDDKKGNYWDDYKYKYRDAHKLWLKGIWDTPYEIPGGDNKDNCPLIKQWSKSLSKSFVENQQNSQRSQQSLKTLYLNLME